MNHPVAYVIAQLLVDADFGRWTGETSAAHPFAVTYGRMADENDQLIHVTDVEGFRGPNRDMRTGDQEAYPGVLVRVRAMTDGEAGPAAWAVARHLDALFCRTVTIETSSYRVQNFSRRYDPVFFDEEDRLERRVYGFRGNVVLKLET